MKNTQATQKLSLTLIEESTRIHSAAQQPALGPRVTAVLQCNHQLKYQSLLQWDENFSAMKNCEL